MIEKLKEKIKKSLSYIKIPGLNGFSFLDLLELYFLGLEGFLQLFFHRFSVVFILVERLTRFGLILYAK